MSSNKNFLKNWTLAEFAREFGNKVRVGMCTNGKSGDTYPAITFTNSMGTRVFVSFAVKLQEDGITTAAEVKKHQHELQIVSYVDDEGKERKKVCYAGDGAWGVEVVLDL